MMQLDFSGKRVLVTHSANGLGRRLAEEFQARGARVAIHGDSGSARRATIRSVDAMSGLDVLVNSDTSFPECRIDDLTESLWEEQVAGQLKDSFFTCQACVPALKASRGCVINVISIFGMIGGPAGTSVIAAIQGGLIQLTRMMALEMARDGIRVNALCHGLHDYVARECPLERVGTVEDCIGGVLYLASPLAAYTTGAMLVVDGGLSSGF